MEPRNLSASDATKKREARRTRQQSRRRPTALGDARRGEGQEDRILRSVDGSSSGGSSNLTSGSANNVRPITPKAERVSRPLNGSNTRVRRPTRAQQMLWQVLRLLVAGIGLSVIAGTLITFWSSQAKQNTAKAPIVEAVTPKEENRNDVSGVVLRTSAEPLEAKIRQIAAKDKDLTLHALAVELDSGTYFSINGDKPTSAASTIKTPLLIAFLQDVDAGKIRLDESLEISKDVLVGESGELQFLPVGTKISALETASKMIIISDNTATNMIIKRLGGAQAVTQRFKSWGLTSTSVSNYLPDLEGTNLVSTRDLAFLFAAIDQGKLLKPRSRDRFMDIMRRPVTNTLLPQGIGPEARIVHKTGDIGMAVGDGGLVEMPNGKRYAIAVMVKRPNNDQRANELVRQVSRASYEYFIAMGIGANAPMIAPATGLTPDGSPNNMPNNAGPNNSNFPNTAPPTNTVPNNNPNSSPSVTPSANPTVVPAEIPNRPNQ
ncbi:MAG: serine hydrolase [Pseudanabaena sp. ELA607]